MLTPIDVFDVHKPAINQAVLMLVHGGAYTATVKLTTNDNVFDFEDFDGILNNRQAVQIGVRHYVSNIAVDKDLAGAKLHELVGWYA
ncbi:hypothetical protein BC936DRAFT_140909 [Jimgerdemannia flammicorona]|uniref:Uncharacterized protein n=2 Tax=Jimgerdemannia flammicorona TaxID=994334 RepID=A0A433DGJ2_9FUNG|nr:hypothetical protein BC936DRAFT_140909 [Jimgerdemannia flammicorona]RUS30738.1 hypothetical protein BC938DRAFT_479023 [Jimgerdemannia flammicorona]